MLAVRPARAEDDAAIESLARSCGLTVDAPRERARDHARLRLLTVGEEEEFAGFVLAWVVLGEVQILDMAVSPQHRLRGGGARLLQELLTEAVGEGAERAFLEVRRDNHPAQALYRRAGFEEVGSRKGYYKDGCDALLFQCCLLPEP